MSSINGKYIEVDSGVELFVHEEGSGEPIVFIQGFTFSTEVFSKQVEYFSKTNRVIVVDPRSHGRSTMSIHGNDYSTHGADLNAVLQALDVKNATLVGWSFGCLTVWEYIKQNGFDNIKSLILVDMPPKSLSTNESDWVEGSLDDIAAIYHTYLRNPSGQREFITNYITQVMVQRNLEKEELTWLVEQSLKTPHYIACNLFASGMFSDYREEAKNASQVAVVTGAASGIGKAIAILYANEGAKVVVSDINLEAAILTVEEIKSSGGEALAVMVNVVKEEDIQNLIDNAVNTYGTLDILVNNAGIMDNFEPAGDIEDEKWERVFAINTTSVMRATRKALPIFLEKQNGIVINIVSAGGLQGARAGAAYTASKHAVVGFTKNTGFMYATKGIRCNAVAPGGVETNISASMTNINPFGMGRVQPGLGINPRVGKPEEIANIALFLASDESSFVNGTVITGDAGWTAF